MAYTDKQLAAHRAVMAEGAEAAVLLEAHDGATAPGSVRLLRLTAEARGARARKWLFLFLGLAPVSVICPPHFLWPLVMIVVGIVGYFLRRGRPELVLGGEGTCPSCRAFQILEPGNAEFPLAHFCTACRKRSLVTLDARAAEPPSAERSPGEPPSADRPAADR